jgi:hypothetical protein
MTVSREIRRLIREMLLQEAMFTPESVSAAGLRISINPTPWGKGGWEIKCVDSKGHEAGIVMIMKPLGMGNCLGAYEVSTSAVRQSLSGLGPLLYDIALEVAGESGLMSDRRTVSPEARNVWRYYQNNRPDIENAQLDSKPGTITPDYKEDDCNQNSANRYEKWQNSALSKVYRKKGTPTIDRLRELGIIEIVG